MLERQAQPWGRQSWPGSPSPACLTCAGSDLHNRMNPCLAFLRGDWNVGFEKDLISWWLGSLKFSSLHHRCLRKLPLKLEIPTIFREPVLLSQKLWNAFSLSDQNGKQRMFFEQIIVFLVLPQGFILFICYSPYFILSHERSRGTFN